MPPQQKKCPPIIEASKPNVQKIFSLKKGKNRMVRRDSSLCFLALGFLNSITGKLLYNVQCLRSSLVTQITLPWYLIHLALWLIVIFCIAFKNQLIQVKQSWEEKRNSGFWSKLSLETKRKLKNGVGRKEFWRVRVAPIDLMSRLNRIEGKCWWMYTAHIQNLVS